MPSGGARALPGAGAHQDGDVGNTGQRAKTGGLAYKWLVMICLMPGITVFLIDVTVVNVALAKFGAVFGVDVATVQWAITAYALASGIVTPMASYLEARFTMKRVWVFALTTFTAASVLCGLAPSFWVLVLGRLLQGLAGGMLLPIAVSALFRAFPPADRGLALGFFAIPLVAGPALGPTLGGYIVTYSDWRLVFFINLPIGAAAVLLGALLLQPGQGDQHGRFDTAGAILSSIAFGALLYGLTQVGSSGWGSLKVQSLIGVGLVTLAIFVVYELTCDEPLLDMRLFGIGQFFVANAVGWVSTVALFGAEFMLPLYLQNLRGLAAVDTGLLLMPQGFAAAFVGPIAGRLTDRIGARFVVMFGFVLLIFNTWQFAHLTMTTSFAALRWLLVVRGAALGCALQPTQLVALAVVPERLRTNASSLNNAMRNIVQSFGIAMLSTIVQTQSVVHAARLGWQVRPDTLQGLFLTQVGGALQAANGLSAPAASIAAAAAVMGQIRQQAAVLAFGDAYWVTFAAAIAAFVVASFLPGRGAAKMDPSMMAAH
jgi:DHA2 family multidrug resistance protein